MQEVSAQVEGLESRKVTDLNGQVRNLVARGIELGERRHPAYLLGEAHQTVVIQDQALEALKLTDRRRDVAQLVTAGNIERKSAYQCTMMLHNWCSGETFEVRDLNYTLRTR